jgi:hypothetical protein
MSAALRTGYRHRHALFVVEQRVDTSPPYREGCSSA